MKAFQTALNKYRLSIVLIFGPIAAFIVVFMMMSAVYFLTDAPGLFDELSNSATTAQRIGFQINNVLFVPYVLLWIVGIPAGVLGGLGHLIYKSFKKEIA